MRNKDGSFSLRYFRKCRIVVYSPTGESLYALDGAQLEMFRAIANVLHAAVTAKDDPLQDSLKLGAE